MLRDHAADLLATKYGEAKREFRSDGKKVDVYFEYKDLGRTHRIFLEAKDYDEPLGRSEVVHIKTDYDDLLRRNAPSILLIVTRAGLTSDAQAFIEVESDNTRHQTIWDIETGLIELETYLRHLIDTYQTSGLSNYYVENGFSVRAPLAKEHEAHVLETKKMFAQGQSCFSALNNWIAVDNENAPVAVLGGYGTGKTSLATKLAAHLAEGSLSNPHARQPIVLKLGQISQYANIEGLIASHFTKTFPIRNFNFHNFISLNAKGRFVVILDGFDEMKHSMTWADFKSQVKSLLLLQGEKSKVVLLESVQESGYRASRLVMSLIIAV
ncbi:NACHT domain-containing protein [uncultured Martelella sp.]|uniref:NACHT domain-containing protein n=1 Tax=uncultured Martelella sp. TaxID=392331 RepID=UPI0029C6FD04|nr:NACHT domain-containing protein [uncultured Martelella sp.]